MAKKKTQSIPPAITREAQIENAFDACVRYHANHNLPRKIPTHIEFNVGDAVEVGGIEGLYVLEVREPFIILENRMINNNHYSLQGDSFIAKHWSSVFLKKNITEKRFYDRSRKHLPINYLNLDLSGIISRVIRGGIIETDFQRGYVWTMDDKLRLIQSVLAGYDHDIGKFILIKDEAHKSNGIQILDGQQRLTTLIGFMSDEFKYEGVYFSQLHPMDRYKFESHPVQCAILDSNQFSRKELLQTFLIVNSAGVPQTEEHLAHVKALLDAEA